MGQSVDLRVLTAEEFGPFRQRNIARYAQELLFARATDTEEHALTEAQGALDEMLPQGAETPRNYLLAAESGGETVGELWCDTTEPETVFINDFFVYPACRGHGWGNAMLRAVEELAAAQSFEQVVTHVYHTNRIALAMFESAGFTARRRAATSFCASGICARRFWRNVIKKPPHCLRSVEVFYKVGRYLFSKKINKK